jgi:hypothetical protein
LTGVKIINTAMVGDNIINTGMVVITIE